VTTTSEPRKRILVTGVFDILHPGHLFLFREAAKMGDVVVIIARDSTVVKLKKRPPIIPEKQRLEVILGLRDVKEAVLGNENQYFMEKALELKPNIILLGPNQKISEQFLNTELQRYHREDIEVKRLTQIYSDCPLSSSSAIKEKIKRQFQPE
jgi:FAD synthetase